MAPTVETTHLLLDGVGEVTYGIIPSLGEDSDLLFGDEDFGGGTDLGVASETPRYIFPNFENNTGFYNLFPHISGDDAMRNCSEDYRFLNVMKAFFSPSQIVVPIIYCLICLIGLIGNGLVMFVIIGSKEMTKSVANIYILNLAVADTLLLVTLPFSSTQRVLLSWPFGVGMCKIVEAIKYLNYFASIFFLTAMSIDRYFAVVYVVTSSRYRTNRNTFFVCLVVWILSFVMVIPLLIYTKLHGDMCALVFNNNDLDYGDGIGIMADYAMDYSMEEPCPSDFGTYSSEYANVYPLAPSAEGVLSENDYFTYFGMNSNGTSDIQMMCKHPDSRTFHVFIIFTFVIGFIIPFTVITVCYAMIVARLLQPSETRSRSRQADRTRRKVTRMVVALVVVAFVCWLPFYVWHLVQIRGIHVSLGVCNNVRDFTFCLCFANSCLNPLLYTFLGHNFQERLRKSIAKSLWSFTFSNFTRYTTNTLSRADTAALSKKMEPTHSEPAPEAISRVDQPLAQVLEDEPCLPLTGTTSTTYTTSPGSHQPLNNLHYNSK